ncbi:MAG: hypothetical protein WD509_00535 [Candidatus Paceibacterota bacterium]
MNIKKDKQLVNTRNTYQGFEFDIATVSPFGGNRACAHAYKRTEKLLIAIHLVTNFVPENEPARMTIRDKSVRMLSEILHLRSGFSTKGSEHLDHVIASLYEVTSLLDILHASGFVSDMNCDVLKKELADLIIFLRESEGSEVSEKVSVTEDDFSVGDFNKGQYVKDTKVSFKEKGLHTQKLQKDKNNEVKKTNSPTATSERRSAILGLVKDKMTVNVKDISSVITDCSEKTIQRELIALVHENVLKKEGERRWSVYSLV